eukprot:tig00021493_g21907.t1
MEEILQRVEMVRYQKKNGTLELTREALAWTEALPGTSSVRVSLASMKGYMVTKQDPAKPIMMRVDVNPPEGASSSGSAGPFTFDFGVHAAREREATYRERDSFRDLLADLLHANGQVPRPAPSPPPRLSSSPPPSASAPAPAASPAPPAPPAAAAAPPRPPPKRPAPAATPPPAPAAVSEREVRARGELLARDGELRRLHEQLVRGGVVTDDEFWDSRRALLRREEEMEAARRTGMPNALISDLKPQQDTANKLHFRVTPEVIHAIFVETPAVHRAYLQNVPHKLSEKEFWTRYFQSKYFFRDRASDAQDGTAGGSLSVANIDPIFAKCLEEDTSALAMELKAKVRRLEPTVNLAADDRLPEGYGVRTEPPAPPSKERTRVLRTLNRHGALILESEDAVAAREAQAQAPPAPPPAKGRPAATPPPQAAEDTHQKVAEQLRLKDLEKEAPPALLPLRIADPRRYFDAHANAAPEPPPQAYVPRPPSPWFASSLWEQASTPFGAASAFASQRAAPVEEPPPTPEQARALLVRAALPA